MNRTRSRGYLSSSANFATYYQIHKDCTQTSWTSLGSYLGPSVGLREEFHDTLVPSFHQRRLKGEIFFNPMSKRTHRVSQNPGNGFHLKRISGTPSCIATSKYEEVRWEGPQLYTYIDAVTGAGSKDLNGSYLPVTVLSPSEIARGVSEACTSCWADRNLADSNLFESVAEYNQIMKMFSSVFIKGATTLKKLLRNPVKGVADVHLMIVYGVKPLVSDVQAIIKGLGKPLGKVRKSTRKTLRLSRSQTTLFSYTSPSTYTMHFDRIDSDEVIIRAMSLDEFDATLKANIGFSDNGLLVTPWELIPWSFVLDWFVNVGDFLSAIAPASDRKQLGSCYVVRRTSSSLYSPRGITPLGSWSVSRPITDSIITVKEWVDRVPALAPPSLIIKSDFKLDEFRRAADALALVTQVISRLAKR